ncbi:hypothetical protein JYU34_002408 [Plutella xylostella]|uniref:Mitochondrial import inner membrane translocase subunit Tim21 n=1 Tax=Plutella xylostella TaxID=51655 RepID=A0ABQ7R2A2_PLUXY|nr:hypothetical protein JYU34_002408 [Plutella xylostella]
MTLISKFRPMTRLSKNIDLIPIVLQTSKKFSTSRLCLSEKDEKSLTRGQERVEVSTDVRPLGEKIRETTKTVSYTGVILAGIGVTGIIFFYVFRELFSSNSPNSIYSAALEKCKNDPRVEDALGAPIKGFGEETSRRRRTHVSHAVYEKDGATHMRMRFYIKGIRNKAVVELDMKQNDYGNYLCRYLLVQLDDFSGKTFIIEDNRAELDKKIDVQMPILSLTQ